MTTATLTSRNRSRKPACGRALADHQFAGCLERSAASETWQSHTTDGRRWLVKVLFNVAGPDPKRAEAVQLLQELSHPALVPTRILPGGPGCLVLASEFPGETLLDFLKQHQLDGAPGIPRQALLRWLHQAALALDEIAKEYGVAHLGLTPKNLQPSDDALLIADHGLMQLMWLPTGQFQGQVQPRYAAPELPKRSKNGPACDQFSLAAIYQELLTGTPPFRSRPTGQPDLTPLAETDRAVIARALDFQPKKRFPSCVELIDALQAAGAPKVAAPSTVRAEEPKTAATLPLISDVLPAVQPTPAAVKPHVPVVEPPVQPTPAAVKPRVSVVKPSVKPRPTAVKPRVPVVEPPKEPTSEVTAPLVSDVEPPEEPTAVDLAPLVPAVELIEEPTAIDLAPLVPAVELIEEPTAVDLAPLVPTVELPEEPTAVETAPLVPAVEHPKEPTAAVVTPVVPIVESPEEPTAVNAAPLVESSVVPTAPAAPVVAVHEEQPASISEQEEAAEDDIKTTALRFRRSPTRNGIDEDAVAPAAAQTPAVPESELPALESESIEPVQEEVVSPQTEWRELPSVEGEADEPTPPETAVEPAPPVEPTRLWNEGHQSIHDDDLDDLSSQPATTIPFDEIFPALNLSTGSTPDFSFLDGVNNAARPAELPLAPFAEHEPTSVESADKQTVFTEVSPFDRDFVPAEDGLSTPSDDWPFPAPAKSGSKRSVGGSTADKPTVAVAEQQSAALHPFSLATVEEPAPTIPGTSEPAFEPFAVTLSTAKLMPKPAGAASEPEAPKAEAPRPIFRTLRSLRREGDSHKSKSVSTVGTPSGQTARRRAADLKALLEAATKAVPPNEPERWITTAEEGEVLECRFPASLPPTGPPINFERFREKWNGKVLTTDDDSALFEVGTQQKFWKRLLGRPTPLYVEVRWSRPRPPAVGIPGVMMRVRLANKGDKRGEATLHQLAPLLVESLRTQLQGGSERRREQRVLWVQPVSATFLLSNGDASGTVEGQSRDLTGAGMGLYLPRILPGTQVSLRLTDPAADPVTVIGKFVRVQRCGDGWYEVGVRFEV